MSEIRLTAVAEQTQVGSYFVANYPPFSVWSESAVPDAIAALDSPPAPGVPLGLYLHIPFCRKRCHFCYFRVYTDKNSEDVGRYLDLVAREWELYATHAAIANRPYSTKEPGSTRSSMFSRAVRAPPSWRRATASGRAASGDVEATRAPVWATPGWARMPIPMMETFATPLSEIRSL